LVFSFFLPIPVNIDKGAGAEEVKHPPSPELVYTEKVSLIVHCLPCAHRESEVSVRSPEDIEKLEMKAIEFHRYFSAGSVSTQSPPSRNRITYHADWFFLR